MSKVAVKKKVEAVSDDKSGLFDDVKGYARKIYLAGLGAYAKAGAEGVGYFKELVKTGEGVESKGKQLVDDKVEAANTQIELVKQSVNDKVDVQLERIEKAFDTRVAAALNRMGIPSKQDVEVLSNKLDELSALLEHLARSK